MHCLKSVYGRREDHLQQGGASMEYTNRQKEEIRSHWYMFVLKFCEDGTVMAKKRKDLPWSILYTKERTIRHLTYAGLWKEDDKYD